MKSRRQEKILELIRNNVFITQEDLQNELLKLGFNVTQSTVSRDIKDLKLVKGHDAKGNYRYIESGLQPSYRKEEQYRDLFSSSAKSIVYSLNNVVIKCSTGMASSACVAIDALYGDMMLGSLAGDDTIIIVTAGEEQSALLTEELKNLL